MQRETIAVLVDEHLRDQLGTIATASYDLVADRRSDDLFFASLALQLLPHVDADDDLRRLEFGYLSRVVPDAFALLAAACLHALWP